jgi:hypothetical protein
MGDLGRRTLAHALQYESHRVRNPEKHDCRKGKRMSGTQEEKRQYRRIPLKGAVLCQKADFMEGRLYTGNTINVCPGGVFMEINGAGLEVGELVNLELAVPTTRGLLEFGGRFSTYARILRIQPPPPTPPEQVMAGEASDIHRIAMEFCEVPRLRF